MIYIVSQKMLFLKWILRLSSWKQLRFACFIFVICWVFKSAGSSVFNRSDRAFQNSFVEEKIVSNRQKLHLFSRENRLPMQVISFSFLDIPEPHRWWIIPNESLGWYAKRLYRSPWVWDGRIEFLMQLNAKLIRPVRKAYTFASPQRASERKTIIF